VIDRVSGLGQALAYEARHALVIFH
jgi:hypothetical protein